jgi:hypothetical protein
MASIRQLTRTTRPVRLAAAVAIGLLISFGAVMTMPRPVAACSCVGHTSWLEAVNADTAVFTGTAGPRQARGVPVQVDRWFSGRGAAATVWLANDSFNGVPGVSNSCGIEPPPAGSSWLWVAYPGDRGDFGTGLCSPAGDLASPKGAAMLREAVAAFGGEAPNAPDPTPNAPDPTPAATADTVLPAPGPAEVARDWTAVTIIAALFAGSLAMFGGLALVARRSRTPDRRPGDDTGD